MHKKQKSRDSFIADQKKNKEWLDYLKKRWYWVLVLVILIIGFNVRVYHLGYSAIGYHNMKEIEFFGEAKIMSDSSDYLRTKVMWQGLSENDSVQEALPILAWYAALAWKIFGINLAVARLLIVMFSLGSILLVFLIVKNLTKDNIYIALTSALFMSFMPLGVFFGRNYQPDMPALFFILLYIFFFIKWLETRSTKDWIFFSICVAMASLLKITNLIGLFTLIFIIPYRELFKEFKKYWKFVAIFLFIMLMLPLWMFISIKISPTKYGVWDNEGGSILEVFTTEYWQQYGGIIKSYTVDENFTRWYAWFAIFGLIFAIIKYKSFLSRFLFGYTIAIIPYIVILHTRFHMHNYYQMPFLPLICILSAFFLYGIGSIIKQIAGVLTKNKTIIMASALIPFIIIPFTLGSVNESTNRQFNMQYIGYDAAGEYIKEHSNPNDRILLEGISAGQGASLFWHAQRYGAWMPENVSEVIRGENEKNFRWIVLYNEWWRAGEDGGIFAISQKTEIWNYISENYQIKQIGFIGQETKPVRIYMVLEKSGLLNESKIEMYSKVAKIYEMTDTKIELKTINGR